MKTIAVPYFPGSNGDHDAISRIKEFGMQPLPLYFHIGNEKRLEDSAKALTQVDGAVVPGGFPYEDRLGFGIVPARIEQFTTALRKLADDGKPVIAFCSGNQIAQAMKLAFPDSSYKAAMLKNICDRDGKIVYSGFLDRELFTRLECDPRRTAFTRNYKPGEVIPGIIDHGGGRFWADKQTLEHLMQNGMIVTRYCTKDGDVLDNFPTNPNGSMLNIESITNRRGNVKIGMCHNERKLNALRKDASNQVFASMREFIEEGCPDLSSNAQPQKFDIAGLKQFSYLSQTLDPGRTVNVYIKMLTDDNERTTAQLCLNEDGIDRRRLLRLELGKGYMTEESVKSVVAEIAKMDFLDGIMLKKDLPSAIAPDTKVLTYEVVGKDGSTLRREFTTRDEIVPGFPVRYEQVSLPDPDGHIVRETLWQNPFIQEAVTNVHTGMVWFFRDHKTKQRALTELLGGN